MPNLRYFNDNCIQLWCQINFSKSSQAWKVKTLDMHVQFCGFSFIHYYIFLTWDVVGKKMVTLTQLDKPACLAYIQINYT